MRGSLTVTLAVSAWLSPLWHDYRGRGQLAMSATGSCSSEQEKQVPLFEHIKGLDRENGYWFNTSFRKAKSTQRPKLLKRNGNTIRWQRCVITETVGNVNDTTTLEGFGSFLGKKSIPVSCWISSTCRHLNKKICAEKGFIQDCWEQLFLILKRETTQVFTTRIKS